MFRFSRRSFLSTLAIVPSLRLITRKPHPALTAIFEKTSFVGRGFSREVGVSLLSGASVPERKSSPASARISAIEARLGGRLGVVALDPHSGNRLEHRANEGFPMCSTFKFLLVANVLSRVDASREKLNRVIHYSQTDILDYAPITKAHLHEGGMTVSALCAAAIEYSDNTAANLLLASVGGPPAVTRYARSLGDSVTRLDRNEPSLNSAVPGDPRDTTTPSAMLADMRKILFTTSGPHQSEIKLQQPPIEHGGLFTESLNLLEGWMLKNTTGATSLRAGLPSAWRVGDKTGSGRNGATNDIAICWRGPRPPILATAYFVGSNASYNDRCAALAEVGRIIAAEFS